MVDKARFLKALKRAFFFISAAKHPFMDYPGNSKTEKQKPKRGVVQTVLVLGILTKGTNCRALLRAVWPEV